MNLCIITARGGSKRIPHKNIKNFCGKPIIAYSIEAAKESRLFDDIVVSTDDDKIMDISRSLGANVPFKRSEKNSDDYATIDQVLNEVLNEYEKRNNVSIDMFCCIYPTAPFLTGEKLTAAYNCMKAEDADAVVSVVKYSYPPQRGLIVDNSFLKFQFPQYYKTRSQDLESIYHDCGQFYFYKTQAFKNGDGQIIEKTFPFVIDETEVQDIDNETDWEMAELKYRLMREKLTKIS